MPCVGLFMPGDAAVTPLNAQCLEMTMVCFSKVSVSPLSPVALVKGIYSCLGFTNSVAEAYNPPLLRTCSRCFAQMYAHGQTQ